VTDSRLLLAGLRQAGAYLEAHNIPHPAHLIWALKARRDPKEPGKREKEKRQDDLAGAFRRLFAQQKDVVANRVAYLFPGKAHQLPLELGDLSAPNIEAEIMKIMLLSTQGGGDLFQGAMTLQMDYTKVNSAAAAWARKYSGELVKGIDQTTLDAIRQAVGAFVDTPGFTIGDVMALLPFGEQRALMIAVTEITRAYATANQIAGKELQRQWPGVKVVKTFNTNKDDRVCFLCAPLDGMEVEIDEGFTTEDDKAEGVPYPPLHVGDRCWMTVRTRING